jgi:hypothetical protein
MKHSPKQITPQSVSNTKVSDKGTKMLLDSVKKIHSEYLHSGESLTRLTQAIIDRAPGVTIRQCLAIPFEKAIPLWWAVAFASELLELTHRDCETAHKLFEALVTPGTDSPWALETHLLGLIGQSPHPDRAIKLVALLTILGYVELALEIAGTLHCSKTRALTLHTTLRLAAAEKRALSTATENKALHRLRDLDAGVYRDGGLKTLARIILQKNPSQPSCPRRLIRARLAVKHIDSLDVKTTAYLECYQLTGAFQFLSAAFSALQKIHHPDTAIRTAITCAAVIQPAVSQNKKQTRFDAAIAQVLEKKLTQSTDPFSPFAEPAHALCAGLQENRAAARQELETLLGSPSASRIKQQTLAALKKSERKEMLFSESEIDHLKHLDTISLIEREQAWIGHVSAILGFDSLAQKAVDRCINADEPKSFFAPQQMRLLDIIARAPGYSGQRHHVAQITHRLPKRYVCCQTFVDLMEDIRFAAKSTKSPAFSQMVCNTLSNIFSAVRHDDIPLWSTFALAGRNPESICKQALPNAIQTCANQLSHLTKPEILPCFLPMLHDASTIKQFEETFQNVFNEVTTQILAVVAIAWHRIGEQERATQTFDTLAKHTDKKDSAALFPLLATARLIGCNQAAQTHIDRLKQFQAPELPPFPWTSLSFVRGLKHLPTKQAAALAMEAVDVLKHLWHRAMGRMDSSITHFRDAAEGAGTSVKGAQAAIRFALTLPNNYSSIRRAIAAGVAATVKHRSICLPTPTWHKLIALLHPYSGSHDADIFVLQAAASARRTDIAQALLDQTEAHIAERQTQLTQDPDDLYEQNKLISQRMWLAWAQGQCGHKAESQKALDALLDELAQKPQQCTAALDTLIALEASPLRSQPTKALSKKIISSLEKQSIRTRCWNLNGLARIDPQLAATCVSRWLPEATNAQFDWQDTYLVYEAIQLQNQHAQDFGSHAIHPVWEKALPAWKARLEQLASDPEQLPLGKTLDILRQMPPFEGAIPLLRKVAFGHQDDHHQLLRTAVIIAQDRSGDHLAAAAGLADLGRQIEDEIKDETNDDLPTELGTAIGRIAVHQPKIAMQTLARTFGGKCENDRFIANKDSASSNYDRSRVLHETVAVWLETAPRPSTAINQCFDLVLQIIRGFTAIVWSGSLFYDLGRLAQLHGRLAELVSLAHSSPKCLDGALGGGLHNLHDPEDLTALATLLASFWTTPPTAPATAQNASNDSSTNSP